MATIACKATHHQGHPQYQAHGKQCVATVFSAFAQAASKPVTEWNESVMDNILVQGNELYLHCHGERPIENYMYVTDLPKHIPTEDKCINIEMGHSLGGNLSSTVTMDDAFFCLRDAVLQVEEFAFLTIGDAIPFYTMGVIRDKSDKGLYLYDSHCRDSISGLCSGNGVSILSYHRVSIVKYIANLSSSLKLTPSSLFEMTPCSIGFDWQDNTVYTSSDDSFSGFSENDAMSEGELECRAYIRKENLLCATKTLQVSSVTESEESSACLLADDVPSDECTLSKSELHSTSDASSGSEYKPSKSELHLLERGETDS